MTSDCMAPRIALGAYVLGALEPADRAAVANHLAGCADCRAELASLAGLPGLLGRLQLADVLEPGELEPDELADADLDIAAVIDAARVDPAARPYPAAPLDAVAPGGLAAVAPGRSPLVARAGAEAEMTRRILTSLRRSRRRARRRAVVASVGLLVVVVLATIGITIAVRPAERVELARPAGQMYTGASTTSPVEAWVWVAANPAGSAFTVRLANVRPGSHCTLVAQAVDGHEETAATWAASYDGDVQVQGTAGIAPASLARLMIIDADGGRVVVRPSGRA
ncbi:anti-sigma factor [Frankia sp. R82]|uniref:anti-sigma factor family protein n=1 Tax=Frankia sp. R82 TaxID=2950553 RepID=UPI0020448874|nr:zf-HC2 domain-containing protein [Frankia sp. R82]MCM3884277.1 zf-HC2 domain-containing protein [Frankia sp. R82]